MRVCSLRHITKALFGPAGTGTLRVLDSANNTVGYWIPSGVVLPIGPDFVVVNVATDGFPETTISLLFASADCTGQPHINGGTKAAAALSNLVISGNVANGSLYYTDTPAVTLFVGSYQNIGNGSVGPCNIYGASSPVLTPIVIPVSSLGYTPPFRLSQ